MCREAGGGGGVLGRGTAKACFIDIWHSYYWKQADATEREDGAARHV